MTDHRLVSEVERLMLARVAAGRVDVPAIGVVAMRCLEVLRQQDFDQRKLVREIEREPMIAAMILRTANAAVYGANPVTKLEQAVARLSTSRLEVVILEYAARKVFAVAGPFAKASQEIWDHSVVVASLSRELAGCVGRRDVDVYYLAGLLHDIGKPVIAALLFDTQRKVEPGLAHWLDLEMWNRVIADTHLQAARLVGKAWKLPPEVMVGGEPGYDPVDRRSVANVVRMANAIAKRNGFAAGPIDPEVLDVTIAGGTTIVGVEPAVVEKLAGAMEAAVAR